MCFSRCVAYAVLSCATRKLVFCLIELYSLVMFNPEFVSDGGGIDEMNTYCRGRPQLTPRTTASGTSTANIDKWH